MSASPSLPPMVWPTYEDVENLTPAERIQDAARLLAEAYDRRRQSAQSLTQSLTRNEEVALRYLSEALRDAGYTIRMSWKWSSTGTGVEP